MDQSILTSFDIFLFNFGIERVLYIVLAVKAIVFLLNFFLCLFVFYYSIKKRLWALFTVLTVDLFSVGVFSRVGGGVFYIFTVFSASAICLIPIFVIRERVRVVGEKELKLARLLTSKVKGEEDIIKPPIEVQTDIEEKEEIDNGYGVDFSHVKKVLSRIEYYPLSQADKRQVSELNSLIYSAERGEYSREIKEKINEGLGALLKIMSKHGA